MKTFSELPDYHFVWKFESNISSEVIPTNVWIEPWLPISDILANVKVKVIFFHGGMLTTQEAVWRGVPTIIMPFGLDQRQASIVAFTEFRNNIEINSLIVLTESGEDTKTGNR